MTKQEFMAMSLPYGLMFKNLNENTTEQLSGVDTYLVANWSHPSYPNGTICVYSSIDHSSMWSINEIKLILRPLADLTKPIEYKGKKFQSSYILSRDFKNAGDFIFLLIQIINGEEDMDLFKIMEYCPINIIQKLIEWHFDIADLISKGEAIDVNTLEENPYK